MQNQLARLNYTSTPNPNPTAKHQGIVNIQLNIGTRPTYPRKFAASA